jgi:short-subunit dehydrogenase
MDLGLTGKKILITGASQGIGAGLAEAFAAEGCELFLTARSGDKLEQMAAVLKAQHGVQVHVLALDMTASGALVALMDFGGDADVLVNNAGAIPGGDLWDVDEERWRTGWELKVFGYIGLTRAMYARMRARSAGVILNNIGNGGENFDFDYVAGTTGNAALMAFTRALGGRSLEHGIRVVGINPGNCWPGCPGGGLRTSPRSPTCLFSSPRNAPATRLARSSRSMAGSPRTVQ